MIVIEGMGWWFMIMGEDKGDSFKVIMSLR